MDNQIMNGLWARPYGPEWLSELIVSLTLDRLCWKLLLDADVSGEEASTMSKSTARRR